MTERVVICSRAMIIHTGFQNAMMKNGCVCIKKPGKMDCVDISEQRKRLTSTGSMKCLRHFMRERYDHIAAYGTGRWRDLIGRNRFSGISVLLLEWTHGGSDDLHGVDLPVFLESSPEETKERRIRRNRDENAASPFICRVVELEQENLKCSAKCRINRGKGRKSL